MNIDNPRDGARWLVEHGFAIFPADHPELPRCAGIGRGHDPATCTDRGKHPAVPFTRQHGDTEAYVEKHFTRALRNVAVAIAACRGPQGARLVVLDSDRPGALEDVAAMNGEPHTVTMRTITAKGTHDHYWLPAGVTHGNGLGALKGVFDGDVRAGNAYVIGVGSLHASGAVYRLEDPEQPPVTIPEWLLTKLQSSPGAKLAVPQRALSKRRHGRVLTGLVKFVLESREGERNNRLFWAACRAFDHVGRQAPETRAIAQSLVDAAVHVGLPEPAARQTVTSAYRTAGGAR